MSAKTLPIETFTSEELARLAGLRYVVDEEPGIARERNGSGFHYRNGHGRALRKGADLRRIELLAIPPAWSEVWICRDASGHLQATGRDDRHRKQYIYHEKWREFSNLAKFWRLKDCPRCLPDLRRRVSRDVSERKLSRNRVLAGMVALLDQTSIRIGNEEYVRQNNSYGLATLRNRHVTIQREKALLRFRGKSGLRREAVVEDKKLVRLLKELKRLPGAHIFQFVDDAGAIHGADAIAVNDYLREQTGHSFTAKDFRTWKASALAAGVLYENRNVEKLAARKKVIKSAIAVVAETLGNTPTVCRKYYIHPALLDSYLNGELPQALDGYRRVPKKGLQSDERILAAFLCRWVRL